MYLPLDKKSYLINKKDLEDTKLACPNRPLVIIIVKKNVFRAGNIRHQLIAELDLVTLEIYDIFLLKLFFTQLDLTLVKKTKKKTTFRLLPIEKKISSSAFIWKRL